MLGDPFDARLMIVIHEHWFQWFHGLVDFRDTQFFYPYKTALGFSDVFLVQGFVYSFIRLIGFGLGNSWIITTMALLVIGNIGWVYLGRKFLTHKIVLFLYVLTTTLSISFVYYFTFNPNIVGYSYLSWISVFIINTVNEKNSHRKLIKKLNFSVIFLVYSLSCWYGAFFLGVILSIYLVIDKLYIWIKNKKIEFNVFKFKKVMLIYLPVQSFLVWVFYYVYVTVANQPDRPYFDLQRNSPNLLRLANGGGPNESGINGALFGALYQKFNLDYEFEYTIGIGIVTTILGLISAIYLVVFSKKVGIFKLTIAFLIAYLFFVQIGETFSFHKIFFENIPGFNSIRFPGRFIIFIGYFFIFLIHLAVNEIMKKKSWKQTSKVFVLFLLLLTLLDQVRDPFRGWDKKLLTNEYLFSVKDEILSKCDYFYFDYPGGWWYDQIEAITFSAQIGIPTVNGYTGAFPPGYPTEEFHSEKMPLKIFDWINTIDKSERGCFITGVSPIRELKTDTTFIDFVGFTNKETLGANSWQWAVSPYPYLYIVNQTNKNMQLNFLVQTTSCFPDQKIKIIDVEDSKEVMTVGSSKGELVELYLNFQEKRVKRLELIVDNAGCSLNNDSRTLYVNIKNFKSKLLD